MAACANNDTIPGDIIPRQKMETIIWQLIQSDEYANILANHDTLRKASTEKMKVYQQVFDLNRTSLVEFKKSYSFYMEHPNISKVMFDSISVKANRQHAEIYNQKKDSLKPAAPAIPVSSLTLTPGGPFRRDSLLKMKMLRSKGRQDTIKSKMIKPERKPKKISRAIKLSHVNIR